VKVTKISPAATTLSMGIIGNYRTIAKELSGGCSRTRGRRLWGKYTEDIAQKKMEGSLATKEPSILA